MATCETSKLINIKRKSYSYPLLLDVHKTLPLPQSTSAGETHYTRGCFIYFHYGCDGTQDSGWGCGYRTLQTAVSWLINECSDKRDRIVDVPSIAEIQNILVCIGDKPPGFINSRDWIGTLEEFYVLDVLFSVPCKILNIQMNNDVTETLLEYFREYSGFIMMGGMSDNASKSIAGIHRSETGVYLLIVDPHYVGVPKTAQELIDTGYVRWAPITEFNKSLYNLCMPLLKDNNQQIATT